MCVSTCPNVCFHIPLCRFQHAVVWILTLVLLLAFAKAKSYSASMDAEKLETLALRVLAEPPAFRVRGEGTGVYDEQGKLLDVINMTPDDALSDMYLHVLEKLRKEGGDFSRLDSDYTLHILRQAKQKLSYGHKKIADEIYATPVGSPRTEAAGDEGFQPTRREEKKLREPGALTVAQVLGVSPALLDDVVAEGLSVAAIKKMHPGVTASQILILREHAGPAFQVLQATGTTAEEMGKKMEALSGRGKDERRIRERTRRRHGAPGYGPGEPFGEAFPDDAD